MPTTLPAIPITSFPKPSPHLLLLLDQCRSMRELKQIHAHILQTRSFFPTSLPTIKTISFCALSPRGDIAYAKALLSQLPFATVFTWNTMIRALSGGKSPDEAVQLYVKMLHKGAWPNKFTFPFVIKGCAESSMVRCGTMVHAHVVVLGLGADPYVHSSLVHMYASGQMLDAAHKLFDGCSSDGSVSVVSWNSMIDGYVKCGDLEKAREVFDGMGCRDVASWNTMINGYATVGDLEGAAKLFDVMPERNLISWNSMLAAYSKCGDVEGATKTFREIPWRDVVSWNAMLDCYANGGQSNEALALFREMQTADIRPTDATIVSLLSACAHLGALGQGKKIHGYIDEHGIVVNTILATALVDMYAKCGCIASAVDVFNSMEQKDVLAWNTIIAAMAMHGHAKEALRLFNDMQDSGIRPDDITFVSVLSACSHVGMVEEGRRLLNSMGNTYGMEPRLEHYGCVIDLLARAGMLEEAQKLIETMPVEPNANAWGALLGGCRIHGRTDVGEHVGRRLLNLQPEHSGRYVLLSNLYAEAKRWEDVRKVRSLMKSNGVAKIPGLSMVELNGTVHQFVAGDSSHPAAEAIYTKLKEITERLKTLYGYLPNTKEVLFDVEDEEKERTLSVHSEKLAIAYGLMHPSSESTVRVTKNLRVCRDCHDFTKMVSKAYDTDIIVRDRNRFHSFKQGSCSCNDYW